MNPTDCQMKPIPDYIDPHDFIVHLHRVIDEQNVQIMQLKQEINRMLIEDIRRKQSMEAFLDSALAGKTREDADK